MLELRCGRVELAPQLCGADPNVGLGSEPTRIIKAPTLMAMMSGRAGLWANNGVEMLQKVLGVPFTTVTASLGMRMAWVPRQRQKHCRFPVHAGYVTNVIIATLTKIRCQRGFEP
jgi:hypothetical protein